MLAGGGILAFLGFALLLVAFVMYILIIVKVFKHAGVGLGILSIFCWPFTFIWGWMKAGQFGFKKLMLWYTIVFVLGMICYGAGAGAMLTSPEAQQAIKEAQEAQQRQLQQDTIPAPAPAPQN